MLLTKEKLQHINSITHEGKVVIVATDGDGKIWYTIKQDGFEDSYLNQKPEDRTGWEGWKLLEFPNEVEDKSVVDLEKEELTDQSNNKTYLLKSLYKTHDQSAVAPVQLISGLGYIYIFRQSKSNTLLADRFVLDGLTNTLTRKLEVRFKRSKQKHTPNKNQQKVATGLINVDSLDYRDINGNEFYEPTTELSLINDLANGWFSVVLLPTNEQDKYRWHIFAYNNGSKKVELTTLRVSDEGLFDVKDYTILDPEPRSIPGVIKRVLDLGTLTIAKGLTATKYDLQRERQTDDGMQLLREAVHVMLVVGTSEGNAAAISFSVAADGTLSQIKDNPDNTTIRRSMTRQVLLPLNTLDEIKAIATTNPPPEGKITGFARGEKDKVLVTSDRTNNLDETAITPVKITESQDYNQLYSPVTKIIDNHTFEVLLDKKDGGNWEVVPDEETGLIFNGIVTAYEITVQGKLRVTSFNHGLTDGDWVQIVDTRDYNGTYTVTKIDDQTFSLDGVRWQSGTTISAKLQTQKRRGVVFDGVKDYLDIPEMNHDFSQGFTVEVWVWLDKLTTWPRIIEFGNKKNNKTEDIITLHFEDTINTLRFSSSTTSSIVTNSQQTLFNQKQWIHLAATIDVSGNAKLYKNGLEIHQGLMDLPKIIERKSNVVGKSGTISNRNFAGKISDLRLWNKARTAEEIKNSMYLQLTGQEVGLVGYWRLDAIVEGKERKVIDFSVNGNDGIVKGGAYVSSVTLHRNLAGTSTPAIKYENEDLFAVSERATYTEEFEFKTNNNIDPTTANPKIFAITYKGKKNRRSQDWITIIAEATEFISLGNSWYKASCRFTVPDGVSVVRSFGISNITGNWNTLEICKHQIQLISDSITEIKYTDDVNLTSLVDNQVSLQQDLKTLEIKENEEALLLKEKRQLEADIATLNLDGTQKQEAITKKETEIKNQEASITTLQNQLTQLQNNYQTELNNPLNYWCKLVCRVKESWICRVYTASKALLYADVGANGNPYYANNYFKFVATNSGYYRIVSMMDGLDLALYPSSNPKEKAQVYAGYGSGYSFEWKPEKYSGDYYLIRLRADGRVLDRGGGDYGVCCWEQHGATHQQWKIIKIGGETNNNIGNARSAVNAKEAELKNANQQLTKLKDELALLKLSGSDQSAKKKQLEERLNQVNQKITQIQTEINTLNKTFISNVNNQQQTPQTMPLLKTDSRGLVTQGALLGFVRPVSRLSAIETCEGNVQLSYFDDQGRMRQTNFDATADSKNPTIEQWIPDSLRTCLKFNLDTSVVTLKDPVSLGNEWTIEAWFSYPFPKNSSANNTLTHSDSGSISIWDGKYIHLDNAKSWYNLENLSTGWHHLAVVGQTTDNKASQIYLFYLDGKEVDKAESSASLAFNGNNYLDCGNKVNLASKSFTIEFWAKRSDTSTTNQFLLGQGTTQANKGLHIGFRNSTKFTFAFYGNDLDATVANDTHWHHWACIYDASSKKRQIYLDGQKIAEYTATNNYTGIGNLYIGKAGWDQPFRGQISELRIWTKTLTQSEIQENMSKKILNPEKNSNLVAYWQFVLKDNKSEAIDISATKSMGTLHSNPTVETSSTSMSISRVGNISSGKQQAGKLAEIRLWEVALSPEEIEVNSKVLLTGNEPGLVAYYPFNEANGTEVRNQTGKGSNGTIAGASWWGCAAPIGQLGSGQVMRFDGVDDYVEIANPFSNTTAFTISAWIKPARINTGNYQGFIGNPGIKYRPPSLWVSPKDGALHYDSYSSSGDVRYDKVLPNFFTAANAWVHIAWVKDGNQYKIYRNGKLRATENAPQNFNNENKPYYIGKVDNFFSGEIAEVCIWNKAISETEIQANMNKRLTGKEAGLVAYYPLNDITFEGATSKVREIVKNNHGTVQGGAILIPDPALVMVGDVLVSMVGDALVSCEYSTVSKDRTAMMRRFFATPTPGGVNLLPDKRIEELELKWIGNGQFAPTLVGYIEGAPPIPSENLTLEDNYNGATSVELSLSEDVVFNWKRSQDNGLGSSTDTYIGSDVEQSIVTAPLGVGQQIKTTGIRAGFKGNLDFSYQFQNESSITSSSSLGMTDALQLSGTQEEDANFPHLGKRFIPKNVGYALVVSALTDIFVTRLQRTGRMIGYQVLPVENIPPDVNTITFLINPAYTMSGSLDGMTGSSATSQRFFKHVPQMRSCFGSLYPASYYRLQEAYDLKQQIDQQDKNREAYFAQFNTLLVDEASLERETNKGDAPNVIVINQVESKPDENLTQEEKDKVEKERQDKLEKELQAAFDQQSEAAAKKQKEIEKLIEDQDKKAHASTSFASWQRKMENIQIRAGKRNIVNTYVWDADGGLHAEAQSFANMAEHSIGGSYTMSSGLGHEGNYSLFGVGIELTVQATFNLTQTMMKTEARSKGIQLNVDLSGVEGRGITDYNDYPILPGEKVNRYRFMSFYLEGSTNNFHDFFSYVVDPEWLASNGEEARALRQAKSKANKAWRVLHRVTYVERPALMGFGRDVRQLPAAESNTDLGQLQAKVEKLEQQNQEMQRKLDAILNKLS
ncbi:LamG-like jellyroll fold domain-containing protein [Nostoc sp. FACHB-280]|uniref:LamG-like jellyroll fold domain-containing protein n=1 Tax=Nostoc sp. FACHB-280 TaxID=2692839 RepID=UPI00168B6CF4|nr:LamG-like jellyroll fold domain-containing protein [Nostoc sp. FACHB-280]MBD2498744.1 LamG domain-containing protein [Nostoc sp. FACHB-280]